MDYIREIDLFTGLTRNETALMQVLLERTKAHALKLNVRALHDGYDLRFKYNALEEVSKALVENIKESVVSDEEVDKVMDLVERMPDQAAKPQELAGKLLRPSDEFESVEERELANYFGLISVLSAW